MSDTSSEPKYYAERDDWADVQPLKQYEGVNPIVPIFYNEEYKDATDYLRGILQTGEKSQRVLQLTEHIIRLNPAHYSAWQYRYQTLLELKSSLEDELALMDDLAIKYLKTYQVWHHRRLLITQIRKPLPELEFIARVLQTDTKNYHTWSYRQWLLSYFDKETEPFEGQDKLWDGELTFAGKMIDEDIRNNSAWHHRFFVVFGQPAKLVEQDVIQREIRYSKEMISLAPNNASAWNYLRGILDQTGLPYPSLKAFVEQYTVDRFDDSEDVIDLDNPGPAKGSHLPAIPAVEFLADIHEKEGSESIKNAISIWKRLGDDLDTVRKNYWEFRIREAQLAA